MSKLKITKEIILETEKLELQEFLKIYILIVLPLFEGLVTANERILSSNKNPSQHQLYKLRQFSVNVDHLNKIFRKKTIALMKKNKKDTKNPCQI